MWVQRGARRLAVSAFPNPNSSSGRQVFAQSQRVVAPQNAEITGGLAA
jgi:hypothetical protein